MIPFKGIMFGGVSDLKESEDSLESICHNDAYQYHENNKWYLNFKKLTRRFIQYKQ
jgi:hypothetical protein